MLQRIRDKSSGPVAYAIVGLIALVFSVWGVGSYFTQSANPAVATVGGTDITKYELQRAYDQRYQRLQQLMGENFDHNVIEPKRFRRTVLENLIQQELLVQYARDNRLRITDQGLLRALRGDERFQVDGSFSPDRYRALLSQAGISAAAFEAGLRNDLQSSQLREAVLATGFVTDPLVQQAHRLRNQERELSYLSFSPDAFRDEVSIGEGEIEAYYRDHPDAFMRDQRVKLAYVSLDRSELEVAEAPDEEFLRTLYEQEKKARFKSPERRKARHILIREDDDTDAEAARAEVQALADQLQQDGVSFADLARERSDDQGTAEDGGSLDWVTRGSMVAPFEEVLFELETGSVSNPVKTEFGWHLIKLEEVEPAEIKPFDDPEVQDELLSLYRSQERQERFKQLSERLDALAFEAPQSLDTIASELDLEIRTTGWVTPDGGTGLASNDAVVEAAFSDAVLKDGLNSTPISLSGDRLVVVRVAENEPAERLPLAEVRDQIRQRIRDESAAKLAAERAQEALDQLEGGDRSLEDLAEQSSGELMTPGWIARDGEGSVSAAVREAAFSLPHPADGQASRRLVALGDGGHAVVSVSGVRVPEDLDESTRGTLVSRIEGRLAGLEYAVLRRAIRADYDVEIYENRLN